MPEPPRAHRIIGVLGGRTMQKIIITTENLHLEASNYVLTESEIVLVGTINDDTPLSYWLKISIVYKYSIEVTAKDTINMWIPQSDITTIQYQNETN